MRDMTETKGVLEEVLDERGKQDIMWGEQNHGPDKWFSILGEEVGEVAHANLEKDWVNYREELIQVAAVAVAMVESFDRQSSPSDLDIDPDVEEDLQVRADRMSCCIDGCTGCLRCDPPLD